MVNHTCIKALVYRRDNAAIPNENFHIYINKVRITIGNPGGSALVVMANFKGQVTKSANAY